MSNNISHNRLPSCVLIFPCYCGASLHIWIAACGLNTACCLWQNSHWLKELFICNQFISGSWTSNIVFRGKTKSRGLNAVCCGTESNLLPGESILSKLQQPKSICRGGYKSLTCAGVRAWVGGGLLYHRSSSKKVPSLSSSSLISSHVCNGVGTVELWGGKKWCRTQLEPGPGFPPSKSNTWTYKLVVTSSEIRYVAIRGLSSNHFIITFWIWV